MVSPSLFRISLNHNPKPAEVLPSLSVNGMIQASFAPYGSPMTIQSFCSVQSREAAEALAGTADRVDVWLMLEYRGVWRPKVATDHDLDAATRTWLDALLAEYRVNGLAARLQMIKQRSSGELRLFTIQNNVTKVRSAPDYGSLITASDQAAEGVNYFVCTHGQRDLCCAEFGLPVYRALRERVQDRVWQTSHLGGHRFAANVLVAPNATLYGRVTPQDLDALLLATENGLLHRPLARGRTCYAPEVQAAEILSGLDTSLESVERLGEQQWRVRFVTGTVGVVARGIISMASCGDERGKPSLEYVLTQVPNG